MGTGSEAHAGPVVAGELGLMTLGMMLIAVLLWMVVDDIEPAEVKDKLVEAGTMLFDAEESVVNPWDPEATPPYPATPLTLPLGLSVA